MSIHHPKGPNKTHDMPSPDHVAKPDEEFQFDESTGLSQQRSAEVARQRKFGHAPLVAAIGLGLTAATALGIVKATGSNNNEAPAPTPDNTTSGPATPGETQAPVVEAGIGVEGTTFETANTPKAKEFVEQAKELIPSDLPIEQIIERIGQKRNIYFLSAQAEITSLGPVESELTQKDGEEIIESLFGENVKIQDIAGTRLWVSDSLHYVNDIDPVRGKKGTWQSTYELLADNGDGTYQVQETITSNLLELRGNALEKAEAALVPQTRLRTLRLDISGEFVHVNSDTLQ